MKTIKKNVYHCEHCKKRGLSASHISRHERICTNNPDRECGMCKYAYDCDEEHVTHKEIMEEIKTAKIVFSLEHDWFITKDGEPVSEFFENKIFTMSRCPACIFAALRQTNTILESEFNFKDAVSQFNWDGEGWVFKKGEVSQC